MSVGGGGQSAGGLNGGGELEGSLTRAGNVRWNVPKDDTYYPEGIPRTQTITIPLMATGSAFLDRLNQVAISIRKVFEMAKGAALFRRQPNRGHGASESSMARAT